MDTYLVDTGGISIELNEEKPIPESMWATPRPQLFKLPFATMPVGRSFTLTWEQYKERYEGLYGKHPFYQEVDPDTLEIIGKTSKHEYLQKYLARVRTESSHKTKKRQGVSSNEAQSLTNKKFRYLKLTEPTRIEVWRVA